MRLLFLRPSSGKNFHSYVERVLKGYDGLGSKFLNGGQNFTINAEKIKKYFCHKRLRELTIEKKCKPLRQSNPSTAEFQLPRCTTSVQSTHHHDAESSICAIFKKINFFIKSGINSRVECWYQTFPSLSPHR